MHITLNLLPPRKKSELRQGYVVGYVRAMLLLLLVVTIVISMTLVSFRIMLGKTLKYLRHQNEMHLMSDTAPENEIVVIDAFLERIAGFQDAFVPWSDVITEISAAVPDEITLASLQVNNDGKVFIRGTAATRDNVLELQTKLDALPFLSELNAPLSNILRRTDVEFTFETRYVKESSMDVAE